jgi:hypothetical protein
VRLASNLASQIDGLQARRQLAALAAAATLAEQATGVLAEQGAALLEFAHTRIVGAADAELSEDEGALCVRAVELLAAFVVARVHELTSRNEDAVALLAAADSREAKYVDGIVSLLLPNATERV